MGNLLRYGVMLAAGIVLIGAVIYLFQHGQEQPSYHAFLGEPKHLTNLSLIWNTAFQGSGRSIIQLGLLMLIATPVARIIFSILGYLWERDFLYVAIASIVLLVILLGL